MSFVDCLGKVIDFSTQFLPLWRTDCVTLIHYLSTEKHTESPFPLNMEGTLLSCSKNFKFCPPTLHDEHESQCISLSFAQIHVFRLAKHCMNT